MKMVSFTRRQWLTLIVIGVADFCNAVCVSLQAPFYPQEAEKKGASATEYGLVFGIFELVVFIVSPLYGHHINRLGPKKIFNGGIYTTAICAILFGLLDKVEGHYPFIILSFIIRIVEAMGNAAFLTASFAIIAKEFPNNVATTFASLETFFGLGLIVGPTVGGALYQVGGYTTPFAVLGTTLFLAAILTCMVLPTHEDGRDPDKASIYRILKIPGVALSTSSIIVTSMSIGFLQATLEPHLRQFALSPVIMGLMFVINGGTYAITAPFWGWICDRDCPPKIITVSGTILVAVGFSLIGPAPYIQQPTILWMSILGLVIHGFGVAAQLVASFTDALRTSIAHGFPNNLETYGIVSGVWTSTFALGNFVGPSISGILFDTIGFRNASMFVVGTHLVVGLLVTLFIVFCRKGERYVEIVKDEGLANGDLGNSVGKSMQISVSESIKSIKSVGNGISIEKSRPPGMNSLIACNSYKSQAWPRKEANGLALSAYSYSYGTIRENKNGNTPFLQGVA